MTKHISRNIISMQNAKMVHETKHITIEEPDYYAEY